MRPLMMRFTLSRHVDPRPTLVVDVYETMEESAILKLKTFMYEYGCASGLIFDADQCLLFRDTFSEASTAAIQEEDCISAPALLATVGTRPGDTTASRVARWLQLLASSWPAAIPPDLNAAQSLLYDVVPAAAESTIHPWGAAA